MFYLLAAAVCVVSAFDSRPRKHKSEQTKKMVRWF
jgi:hypothetical protein